MIVFCVLTIVSFIAKVSLETQNLK